MMYQSWDQGRVTRRLSRALKKPLRGAIMEAYGDGVRDAVAVMQLRLDTLRENYRKCQGSRNKHIYPELRASCEEIQRLINHFDSFKLPVAKPGSTRK